MPLAKITKQGLTAMALSVGLLWGCVLGDRMLMRKAIADRAAVMRQVVRTRPQPQPVLMPAPLGRHRALFNAG